MKQRKSFFQRYRLAGVVGVLFLILGTGVSSLRAEVTASATLNVQSFPMNRAASLSLVVNGVRSFKPQMPEVEGLRFHRRGQSTQMEFINGVYSVSVTSMFLVEALHSGSFTIPAIQIQTKEGTVETSPIQFEVTAVKTAAQTARQQQTGHSAAAATRLRSGEADKVAFMRVFPAREQSYSGEVIPVQIKAYFREGIQANLNSLPQLKGEGFVLKQQEREPVQSRERVNNTLYAVLTWDSALSGIKEGEHKLSMEVEATLLLREQRRRSSRSNSMFSDPFFGDSFFDDFFGSYREKEVKVASPELTLTVLPLPAEGRPDTFSGAIGNFRLQVTADPVVMEPGDPITLTMTVSGQGNFDRVQAPQLSDEKGWKSYTPSSEFLKDGGKESGKKVFEQALVAKDPSLRKIPPVLFSYFDPVTGRYETLQSKPIALHIGGPPPAVVLDAAQGQKEGEVAAVVAVSPDPSELRFSTLSPLKLASGKVAELKPLLSRSWFQILIGLLLLATVVGLTIKIRAARYAGNPRLQRNQKMGMLLTRRLQELEQSVAAGDTRRFLVTCRSAIQEQLGLLWEAEAGAITVADLQRRLPGDSVLLAIFKAAEESAYGGQELSAQQMQEYAAAMKKELEGLL